MKKIISIAVALLLVVVAVFAVGSFHEVYGVGARWMDFTQTYSDGWLMFGVSVFLIARQLRLDSPVYQPQPIWLLPLFGAVILSAVGAWLDVEVVQDLLLVPILLMALGSVWGWRQLQRFLVPVGLLIMVTPFWDFLDWPLQLITVQANRILLSPLGIQFHVDGIYIYLHNIGAIEIEGGCSGLRYLIVAISLCLIFGHLTFRQWRTLAKFVATGAAFGIVTNWLRVYVITLVAYESHMQASLVRHHDFFGWVLFGVILVPLFWLGGRYSRAEDARIKSASGNQQSKNDGPAPGSTKGRWVLPVTLVLLLLPRAVEFIRTTGGDDTKIHISLNTPSGWLPSFSAPDGHWSPVNHGATVVAHKYWVRLGPGGRNGDDFLSGYVAAYLNQSPGKELVQYGNRLFDASKWAPKSSFSVQGADGREYSAIRLKSRVNGRTVYVAYGYYVSGLWVRNEIAAKLAQLASVINGRHDNSLIAAGIECDTRCQHPKAELASAMDSISGQVKTELDAFEADH